MADPIVRETCVDENLLEAAENIVNNFPKVTDNFNDDIDRYRTNSKTLNELLYQRNLPNDSEGIDRSKYMSDETFLIVKLNPRVEAVLDRLIKLQSDYLDKILENYRSGIR